VRYFSLKIKKILKKNKCLTPKTAYFFSCYIKKMEVTMNKLLVSILVIGLSLILNSTTIYDIQYTTEPGGDGTYPSPLVDQEVTVEGIVTALNYNHYPDNFVISMPEGGAWKGILIYMSGDETCALGDEVEITGTVREYYGLTEISGYDDTFISVTHLSSGNPLPNPVALTTDELSSSEEYEGVLVQLSDVYVSQVPDGYGQWYVVDTSATLGQIDDSFFFLDDVDPPIEINLGDFWVFLAGIVAYSYDEYELSPRTPDDMVTVSIDEKNIENIITTQNFPNPFTSGTTIRFNIKKSGHTKLEIFNAAGKKVKTLLNENKDAANYNISWDGTNDEGNDVAAGVYFYKLKHGGRYTSTKKMILMK